MKRDFLQLIPRRWNAQGAAVGQDSNGMPVAVWGGIPGEEARVEIVAWGRNRAMGHFGELVRGPHPRRRPLSCRRYYSCGGCPLMHLDDEGQARAKLALVRQAFEDIDVTPPKTMVPSPVGDEDYRHIIKLVVGRSEQGYLRVGTYQRHSHKLVTIPLCNVATPTLREAMRVVSHHIIDMRIQPYEVDQDRGLLRYVVMRQSSQTGTVLVTLVSARNHRSLGELAERIQSGLSAISGVLLHCNSDPGNAIYSWPDASEGSSYPFRLLSGQPTIEESLGGMRLQVGGGEFFQANPPVAELILADLLEEWSDLKDHPVLDLYAGVGTFTIPLAAQHGWAMGIETVPSAVITARANARRNRVSTTFLAGKVGDLLPTVAKRVGGRGALVLVDPARRGLEADVVDQICQLEPARLAYLACSAASLARDLGLFLARGWKVDRVRAYDMFPQTAHIELLATLTPPVTQTIRRRGPQRRLVRNSSSASHEGTS